MALSRKRQKELNRLKGQAEDLWEDQKELLDHAARDRVVAARVVGLDPRALALAAEDTRHALRSALFDLDDLSLPRQRLFEVLHRQLVRLQTQIGERSGSSGRTRKRRRRTKARMM